MNLLPRIEELKPTILVGVNAEMSLVQNRTAELWRNFMPRRRELLHAVSADLYSLQIYPSDYFRSFNPATTFLKWAGMAVSAADQVPEGMEVLNLAGGKYAVFQYKGMPGSAEVFQYIFGTWLPSSGYALDHRPHFELLGEKYKNNDPESEEEIWIPVV